MNLQRFVLALLLSFVITVALTAAYIFAPIFVMLAKSRSSEPGTAGIAAVSGGGISSWALLLTESMVFAILFFVLSRRRTR